MTTDPNVNTQAEIYANIRDKALLEGALKELQACSDDLHSHGHALAAARVEKRIRALKKTEGWHDFMCEVFGDYP